MPYLIQSDYYSQIQIQNLLQIIGSNPLLLSSAAAKAQEQCEEKLIQKYDLSLELTDTTVWSYSLTYNAWSRFYLDAIAYNPANTYGLTALILQAGNVYICSTAITIPEAFNSTHWTLLGAQNQLFYAQYPQPVFNNKSFYKVGDHVYWKGKTHIALIATQVPDSLLQYGEYSNVPLKNVFPDDPVSGTNFWGVGSPYLIPSGTLPTNTTYYTQGDNRSQRLLEIMIDITLYKIHGRISPMNIPILRVNNYHLALEWLKDAYGGESNVKLPIIQPVQGTRTRYGGNIKIQNHYAPGANNY